MPPTPSRRSAAATPRPAARRPAARLPTPEIIIVIIKLVSAENARSPRNEEREREREKEGESESQGETSTAIRLVERGPIWLTLGSFWLALQAQVLFVGPSSPLLSAKTTQDPNALLGHKQVPNRGRYQLEGPTRLANRPRENGNMQRTRRNSKQRPFPSNTKCWRVGLLH